MTKIVTPVARQSAQQHDPQRWQEVQTGRRIVEQNPDALARCVRTTQKTKVGKRCLINVDFLDAS